LAYKISILPVAQKQILSLSGQDRIKAAQTIDALAVNPRPHGCKKIKGSEFWRVRSGCLRVIYTIADKQLLILILKVARRQEDTYRNLD